MSYGHADKIAHSTARPPVPSEESSLPPVDPARYWKADLRAALARHDFATVYRALKDEAGLPQSRIAALTGQSQSEVSEILTGRRVLTYALLARIVTGLGIPRQLAGLSWYGPDGTYAGEVTDTEPEEADEMLRRHFQHLLALGAAAAFGGVVPRVGELDADLPLPAPPGDLPSRIGTGDVAVLRGYREQLGLLARTHGGQARAAVALTEWADRWPAADASDIARHALLNELSHLHTITAWCCHDCGVPGRALYHFGRAVELAIDADDSYQAAFALRHAAMMLVERARPNDALKAIQLGSVRLLDAPRDDPRVPVLRSWCHVVSALALSRLDGSESVHAQARGELARSRDGWAPPHAHAHATMDLDTAHVHLHLGNLDTAESAVTVSARTFGHSGDRREGVVADITRARLHVLSGDSGALRLAESAVHAITQTRSGVARQIWLPPLAEALESRRGGDYAELARTARQVATIRA